MITIFTPVYNRAYIIENLYTSLLRQTNYEFEWLIVDDGSSDNLSEMVSSWIAQSPPFPIRFYRQENGGKHRAINRSVQLAAGDGFFIVDSDDYLVDDAVRSISEYWERIKDDPEYAGISGLKAYSNGEIIGDVPLFGDYIDATNLERKKYGLERDKAEVYKTDILKRFPFPEYEGETFITEAVVWDKIAYEGYKLRWINKTFTICEYRLDGLTAKGKKLFIDNPKGWATYIKGQKTYQKLNETQFLYTCFKYYEHECIHICDTEMKERLGLDDEQLKILKQSRDFLLKNLIVICKKKKVCIYAYGSWGKRLKRYLDTLNIQVMYIIDKNYKKITDIPAYTIEMDLPATDVILIALKNNAEEVRERLVKKMDKAEIIRLEDITDSFWKGEI